MEKRSSGRNGIEQSDSDTKTGEPRPKSKGETDVEIQLPESHAYDDLDRLTATTFNRMLWLMRVVTPFFMVLGYVLEKTIYRDGKRKKFDSTEEHTDQ